MNQIQDRCERYSSPMLEAIRTRNQVALEQVLHHLVAHCVEYDLPIAPTVNQVIEANREYCHAHIPDRVAWLDGAALLEQSPSRLCCGWLPFPGRKNPLELAS